MANALYDALLAPHAERRATFVTRADGTQLSHRDFHARVLADGRRAACAGPAARRPDVGAGGDVGGGKRVVVDDDLPRNAMGKVQKNVQRERFAGVFAVG